MYVCYMLLNKYSILNEWQWHQLGNMQVCTSLQIANHASTPPLSYASDNSTETDNLLCMVYFHLHFEQIQQGKVQAETAGRMFGRQGQHVDASRRHIVPHLAPATVCHQKCAAAHELLSESPQPAQCPELHWLSMPSASPENTYNTNHNMIRLYLSVH